MIQFDDSYSKYLIEAITKQIVHLNRREHELFQDYTNFNITTENFYQNLNPIKSEIRIYNDLLKQLEDHQSYKSL